MRKRKFLRKLKKRVVLGKIVDAAKKSMFPDNDEQVSIEATVEGAWIAVKGAGGRRQMKAPRILLIPS